MARSFPPDVIVLDNDSLVHARFARGKGNPRLVQSKSYRLAANTFNAAVVTPEIANESSITDALRRLRVETGKWEKVSVLLPDAWFRINILELPTLPERADEAFDVVRWSLKRTLPIAPEELRVAYEVLRRDAQGARMLVLSAVEKSLAHIERLFSAAGFEVVLIEPIGLNIWNAIAVREAETTKDRLFVYVRDTDFTTAVFRGDEPLFVRSRNLHGDRTLQQEIRLSASYLRETLGPGGFEQCYLAGNRIDGDVQSALASEFGVPVRAVALGDFVEQPPSDTAGMEAELTACTGVFTG